MLLKKVNEQDLAAYIAGELPWYRRWRIQRSIRRCPEVRRLYKELEATWWELDNWAVPPCPDDMQAQFKTAFREEFGIDSVATPRARQRTSWIPVAAWSGVMCVLLAVVVSNHLDKRANWQKSQRVHEIAGVGRESVSSSSQNVVRAELINHEPQRTSTVSELRSNYGLRQRSLQPSHRIAQVSSNAPPFTKVQVGSDSRSKEIYRLEQGHIIKMGDLPIAKIGDGKFSVKSDNTQQQPSPPFIGPQSPPQVHTVSYPLRGRISR